MSSELPTSLRFLTQKQLAELLNLSERTLERYNVRDFLLYHSAILPTIGARRYVGIESGNG
jgi:hypothetical protein